MTPARWIGLLGLGLAVSGAGWFLAAPLDDPAGKRTQMLVFAWLGVTGNALQLVFFAGLRELAGDDPLGRWLARAGFAGILAEVVGVSIAFSIFGAVAYGEPAPEVEQALTDVAWFLVNLAAGPVTSLALLSFGIALARSGVVGRWLVPFSVFVALAHLAVAGAFARDGFLSPEGGIGTLVPLIFFSWFAVVGATLSAPAGESSTS